MALITRSTDASMDVSTGQFAPQITGLLAGEDLAVAAPCYIKSSDGKVYEANGTSANEAAEVAGFTPRAVKSGQPVTLFGKGTRFHYGSSLTPGDIYYLGATAGRVDTAATTGDAFGVLQAITATDVRVVCDTKPLTSATVGAGTITATELASDAVTLAKVAAATMDGTIAKVTANANVIGGLPVVHRIDIASGANGDTDVTLTHKTRVIDVWAVMTAAQTAGSTLTVKNSTTAITDAFSTASAGDRDIVRAGEISDAQHEVVAGGTLRVSKASTGGDFGGAIVYVLGLRVS